MVFTEATMATGACKPTFLAEFVKIYFTFPFLLSERAAPRMGRPPLNWTCLGAKETILTLIIRVCCSENFVFVSLDVTVKDALFDMSAGANF